MSRTNKNMKNMFLSQRVKAKKNAPSDLLKKNLRKKPHRCARMT